MKVGVGCQELWESVSTAVLSKAASRMQSEAPTPSTGDEQDPTVAPGVL